MKAVVRAILGPVLLLWYLVKATILTLVFDKMEDPAEDGP
jgi:hypothetical protein